MAEKKVYTGTGRRKSSIAQVRMTTGKGSITVNGRDVRDFFPYETNVMDLLQPLVATGNENTFDGTASVSTSTAFSDLKSDWVLLDGDVTMVKYGAPHGDKAAVYREYQAEMQSKLEQSDVTLLQGKYEGEIYVHVVTE